MCIRDSLHVARHEMCEAGLLGTGLPGKNFNERRITLHQMVEARLDGAQIFEWMHAFGAGTKFAGSLWATQQQNAENGYLVTVKIEGFLKPVYVLGDAAIRGADRTDQDCPSSECRAWRTAASSRFMTGSRFDF